MLQQVLNVTWKHLGFLVSSNEKSRKSDRQTKKCADNVGLQLINTYGTFLVHSITFKVQPLFNRGQLQSLYLSLFDITINILSWACSQHIYRETLILLNPYFLIVSLCFVLSAHLIRNSDVRSCKERDTLALEI